MNTAQYIERFRKPVLIFAGLVSVYALAGFVLLPKYMHSKLPGLIETETGRKASLERVEFNPFSLELSLQGFSMQEQDLQTFVSFKELFANVQVWSSIGNLALVLEDLRLTEPYVRVETLKDDRYNFSDLLSDEEDPQETEESEGIFPVIINKLALNDGKFATIDALKSEPVNKVINNINLKLERFSTLPQKNADLGFSMRLNGGSTLEWSGSFGVNPIQSRGKVTIQGLPFADIWSMFLQDSVQFKWVAGTQAITFDYELSYPEDELFFTLNQGHLETENLTFIGTDNNAEFLIIPGLSVAGISFDLNKQTLDIDKIESTGSEFKLWPEQSGEINFQKAFAAQESDVEADIEKEQQTQTDKVLPWNINIKEIAFATANINYTDRRKKETVEINIETLGLGIKNAHLTVGELLELTADQGFLDLQELVLQSGEDGELLKVPVFKVSEVDVNLQDKQVKIASINTSDALIKPWLDKSGELNFQRLFAVEDQQGTEKNTEPASSDTKKTAWLVELNEFKIDNYEIQFKDYTTAKPVVINLSSLNFSVTDIDTKTGTQLPFSFSSKFNKKGTIELSGRSVLDPFSADINVAVSQLGIDAFEPYIQQSARLDIVGGNINTRGKLAVAKAEQADLNIQYTGNINIKGLHTRDQILHEDFLKWQALKLDGLDFNLQKNKLNIKSINLVKPYAKVTIKKDKTTNISDVIVTSEPDKKPAPDKKEASPLVYKINQFSIADGDSDFADYSLILPFVVHLNSLEGDIRSISSNRKAKTKVALKGKAFDLSPVEIKGNLNSDFDDFDIEMHFQGLPLPFISPYMVEFSGNKIEKGKMTLDLRYKVRDNKLTANNSLLIDQFEVGEKVDNPNAINLPLGLAAVLLRDKDGRITINMPLEGSMDDPEFSVGSLILDVFVNLIIKIAASPFTAIGSFLQSDADFSVVTFAPGSAEIDAEQSEKLDGLATALVSKSELSLEVRGEAFTNQDWPAMNAAALTDQLKQIYSDELKKSGKIMLAEYIELSDDDYKRLLADLFIKTYPDLAERSFFGTPQLIYPDMGEFYTVAKNMLQGMIAPENNKLLRLALTRARNIARYLVETGTVDQARIFILDGKVSTEAKDNQISSELTLAVQ